jgi:hypothetical protein
VGEQEVWIVLIALHVGAALAYACEWWIARGRGSRRGDPRGR